MLRERDVIAAWARGANSRGRTDYRLCDASLAHVTCGELTRTGCEG
jgi:hypothetical protein